MAERRMFAKSVIESDSFLEMPESAKLLYFYLGMYADDDGFISNLKKMLWVTGSSDKDLQLLVDKNYIILFESGIAVIRHWKINNYIRSDRYKETVYQKEKEILEVNSEKEYVLPENMALYKKATPHKTEKKRRKNDMNNFDRRQYDMDKLEDQLLRSEEKTNVEKD